MPNGKNELFSFIHLNIDQHSILCIWQDKMGVPEGNNENTYCRFKL
jgi:hypothetical protein